MDRKAGKAAGNTEKSKAKSAGDAAIRLVAKRRKEFSPEGHDELRHLFATLGDRATAPLIKHFTGKADTAARQILDSSRLSDEDFARITGGAEPLPAIIGDISKGARYLTTLAPHLAEATPVGKLALTGGQIGFGTPGLLDRHEVLAQAVPPGSYTVTAYYSEADLDALPTAGVEAVMVRFSDAPPASWIEAISAKSKPVMRKSDVVSFCLFDAGNADLGSLSKATAVELENCYAGGDGVAIVGDGEAIVTYVGEGKSVV